MGVCVCVCTISIPSRPQSLIPDLKLNGKYSLESTDPRESEIRAPPQPLPCLMPIPPNTLFYNKNFITAFLSLGLGNTS